MTTSEAQESIRKRSRMKWALGANTGMALLLALLLVVMVNYLSYRHYKRYDWSQSKYYALSDKTKSLLASLSNRLDVIVFFQPGQSVYEDVDNLLREYEYVSKMLHVERVDPDRNLARTEELAKKYQVSEANVVVFDHAGRSKYVKADEIMEIDYSGVFQGEQPERTVFKGEQAFSEAIQSITQERKPIVYFLEGHGERSVDDHDPYGGFSSMAQQIQRDNVDVKTFRLGEKQNVPEEADAVIIAGPEKRFSQPELDVLQKYLESNGRLLLLQDAMVDTGLEPLLEKWGLRLGKNRVVDPTRTFSGLDLFVAHYGAHPITKNIQNITTIFYLPCSVEPLQAENDPAGAMDKPRVMVLAESSENSWADSDLDQDVIKYEEDQDRKGPIPLAVAMEKGRMQDLEMDIRPTRLVVFGDTDFVSNGALSGGNVNFFLNALNWLLEREQLLAIAPKPANEVRLIMDQHQLNMLFWMMVVGIPGAVALLGAVVGWRRKSS